MALQLSLYVSLSTQHFNVKKWEGGLVKCRKDVRTQIINLLHFICTNLAQDFLPNALSDIASNMHN